MEWAAAASCWASLAAAGARWLRVAQREHYLPGSASRFAARWWLGIRGNLLLLVAGGVATGLSWPFPLVGLGPAAIGAGAPVGLSVRGRTSALRWTRRLRTLGGVWLALEAGLVLLGDAVGRIVFLSALGVLLAPVLVDLACVLTLPLEDWLGSRHVSRAAARLRSVRPKVVAITGSYGKTTTKNYVAHLLEGSFSVVASPASFNNRAGLARAVNEQLVQGTEVFVAEMGTYGPGEIAELCSWCPPDISVITAIGPVHLERFGSEDAILRAKSEIVAGARIVVLNADDARLATLADELAGRQSAPRVIRCSSRDVTCDVYVGGRDQYEVAFAGARLEAGLSLDPGVQPTNLACALGVAWALGVPPQALAPRLTDLPSVPHRLSVGKAASGVIVIDDTFNSNPAGTRAALDVLRKVAKSDRRAVVTPGMVELGPRQ
ncbi:MAG TPA: UDP-N-acetylmuramoyl-tripeptide--D-alanyl-D-alanine ligase, partial [Acidimicrobiia bacterium]|nr:UDP-N-acetylmuramoyl-tripeptide--D-alanyl-D-alanine ligase [Acidimicrobiia bacterium]